MSCFLLVSQDLLTYPSSETFFTYGTCSKWYRKTKLQSLLHFSNAISKWSRNIFFLLSGTLYFYLQYSTNIYVHLYSCSLKHVMPCIFHFLCMRVVSKVHHHRVITFHCQCNGIITTKLFRSFKCYSWSFRSFPVCSMIYNDFHTFPVSKLLAKGKRYMCTHYTCIQHTILISKASSPHLSNLL